MPDPAPGAAPDPAAGATPDPAPGAATGTASESAPETPAARGPRRPRRARPRVFAARVTVAEQVTPGMRRLTIAAPELADYAPMGPDEYLGLLLPRTEHAPLVLPPAERADAIRAAVAELPEEVRPELRWYTLRAHRPADAEIDVDFVVHGDEGPGTRFARRARPGSALGIRECTALYDPPPGVRTQVIAGDESAIPAIARILESTPGEMRTHAFIEIADPRDRQDLGAEIAWVDRDERPGAALERAVRAAELPDRIDYAWVCAERGGVQGIRRHLVDDRGVAKSRIVFSGYWRLGEARG
ncbi:siderophore-interacting protein [Leucobacter celer]|uniref:siderophore-interacting protein n=1 Tax=Leucobacter celer TaxID=668625 RepID=UPI0009F97FEE|nr:siderophore-interacting protein [Leucobacter celer]